MTLKNLIDYLECLPKDEKELLEMDVKIRVTTSSGNYGYLASPKRIHLEDVKGKDNKETIIIETGVVI